MAHGDCSSCHGDVGGRGDVPPQKNRRSPRLEHLLGWSAVNNRTPRAGELMIGIGLRAREP